MVESGCVYLTNRYCQSISDIFLSEYTSKSSPKGFDLRGQELMHQKQEFKPLRHALPEILQINPIWRHSYNQSVV